MRPTPRSARPLIRRLLASGLAAVAAVLAACRSTPPEPPRSQTADSRLPADGGAAGVAGVRGPVAASAGSARPSAAATPRAYRQDAATHLYGLNAERIFQGKLPPMLYAIAVLDIDIDRSGRVTRLRWLRAPRHAPEVVAEIERTVRAAAPFPAPARMGKVTYTDTWLWHKSGRFQLDTLTEGQL